MAATAYGNRIQVISMISKKHSAPAFTEVCSYSPGTGNPKSAFSMINTQSFPLPVVGGV